MDPQAQRLIVKIAAAVISVFFLFCVSVAVCGPWWRFEDMPRPEEWSAFFGASALVALAFAWYQIRQVDQSNKALIASNELARQVNLEAVRPRVQVSIEATRSVTKIRGAPVRGTIHIAVRNTGSSSANNVRLKVSPPFTSLETFFQPGMMPAHFAEVNAFFDGSVRFPSLTPGKTYIWYLGRAPDLFEDETGVPRRWQVEVKYSGTASGESFQDIFTLDMDVEKRIELPVDPLDRIGKDLEVVGGELGKITNAVSRGLSAVSSAVGKIRR